MHTTVRHRVPYALCVVNHSHTLPLVQPGHARALPAALPAALALAHLDRARMHTHMLPTVTPTPLRHSLGILILRVALVDVDGLRDPLQLRRWSVVRKDRHHRRLVAQPWCYLGEW